MKHAKNCRRAMKCPTMDSIATCSRECAEEALLEAHRYIEVQAERIVELEEQVRTLTAELDIRMERLEHEAGRYVAMRAERDAATARAEAAEARIDTLRTMTPDDPCPLCRPPDLCGLHREVRRVCQMMQETEGELEQAEARIEAVRVAGIALLVSLDDVYPDLIRCSCDSPEEPQGMTSADSADCATTREGSPSPSGGRDERRGEG